MEHWTGRGWLYLIARRLDGTDQHWDGLIGYWPLGDAFANAEGSVAVWFHYEKWQPYQGLSDE